MYFKIVQYTGRFLLPLDFSYFMEIKPNGYEKINGCIFKLIYC